jgi:FKBP-type peptidyl-prolyl cis-trans isomerase 2
LREAPLSDRLVPGARVRHPGEPEWGVGQVQSAIGDRVTVNFEHAGKRLINTAVVTLVPLDEDERPRGR